ncbi:hypothetical protein C8R45DRAFT_1093132 [Mycena sanguinolenta]|nr:hypothetical protein C8R45DRAFT_1093132 [Mycena sanguinolenta]
MAACKRVLEIPEIVRIIVGEFWLPKTTLVRLATTSKIFTESALDLIWFDQTSLVPLVKCMPETLWEVRGQGSSSILHLRRPIISTDLPRFLFYSARVRSLTLRGSNYRFGTVHPDVLRALDMALHAQCFLKLSEFSWSPKKKDVVSIMRHFLGNRIKKIDLQLDDTAMLSIFPFAKASCPSVSNFSFRLATTVERISLHLVFAISDAVCGWQNLTCLAVPDLDRAAFTHVAELPLLTNLSLTFVDDPSHNLSDFLSGPTFPALEYLFVCCKTARFCTSLIRVVSSRRLTNLTIHTMSVWTTSAWQELHTAMHDCLNRVALDHIEVEEWRVSGRPSDNVLSAYVLSPDVVRPLLAFKGLATIRYQIHPCLDVDDEFLEEMAKAWPEVVELEFGNEAAILQAPRSTLQCLVSFAQHCPDLLTLGIRMDATRIPEFVQVPGSRISSSLDCLCVGTSWIDTSKDSEGRVAAFISNLFPRLQYVSPYSGDLSLPEPLGLQMESWSHVSQLIPVFSSVRTEEEEFWNAEFTDTEDGVDTNNAEEDD